MPSTVAPFISGLSSVVQQKRKKEPSCEQEPQDGEVASNHVTITKRFAVK